MSDKLSYNVDEAAEAIGVKPDTIRRAARAGDLLGKRTGKNGGGYYIFPRAELEAYIENLTDAEIHRARD